MALCVLCLPRHQPFSPLCFLARPDDSEGHFLGSHVDGSIDCRRLRVGGNSPGRLPKLASTSMDVCMGLAAA
ncbi:hypothetical protein Taro_007171 [Colocasia esculenta]|uniref:Uncharacterized protein n=1 Tax=Colocasia esculenta TaxID=4460 RepID=A0A843TZ04_COLES|nr:hypothetical protein [Colocasia esculenta]